MSLYKLFAKILYFLPWCEDDEQPLAAARYYWLYCDSRPGMDGDTVLPHRRARYTPGDVYFGKN